MRNRGLQATITRIVLQRSRNRRGRVYSARCRIKAGLQVLCAVSQADSRRTHSHPSRAAWRAPPQSARTWVAGATRHCGEIHVFSVVIGFGVATLFATGFLFVVQMVDDFRGA
jgi:hypothetical protein